MKRKSNRKALVLLIVLGMLGLFSLLAVTYVVFASQTRATSVQHTRRYVRETPTRPLLEEAAKQLIRGTTNSSSAVFGHDMLGDLFGANETQSLGVVQTRVQRLLANGNGDGPMSLAGGNDQRPLLLGGGRFLRIPIDPSLLPATLRLQDDSINGRIITFLPGQGPLAGLSFRVLRYIGDGSTNSSNLASSVFSITIDLQSVDTTQSHSHLVLISGQRVSKSMSIAEWALESPTAAHLCYDVNSATNLPDSSYGFVLNAVPLNGHGAGIGVDASSQLHRLNNAGSADPSIRDIPVGLMPRVGLLSSTGSFVSPNVASILGDTDEPIDAADYNTMFMSYRKSSATASEIIPSFHRAALINYLINFKPFDQFTEDDFWATVKRIELAALRPLAIDIRSSNRSYSTNLQFDTSTIPTLRMDLPNTWNANILLTDSASPPSNFRAWLTALIGGPWDVDNNSDGIADSVWLDIGLPLQQTPDGKLLKALVAYYVDDMDGKLDINASGGTAQASSRDGNQTLLYGNSISGDFNLGAVPAQYSSMNQSAILRPVWQGMGYGPADISMLHLFRKNSSDDLTAKIAYAQFMISRYRPNAQSNDWQPGENFWGVPSKLRHLSETSHLKINGNPVFTNHYPGRLPGLPSGIRGRMSIVQDWLGNPFVWNHIDPVTSENNEYESRLVAGSHADSPIQFAEWEKIYRWADSDNSHLPGRLKDALRLADSALSSSTLGREISPRNRHLLVPKLSVRGREQSDTQASSFYQLVNTVRKLKAYDPANSVPPGPVVNDLGVTAFAQMFPLEFRSARGMNLNRPFGNGIDDNNLGEVGFGEVDEPTEIFNHPSARSAIEGSSNQSLVYAAATLNSLQGNSNFDPEIAYETGLESRQLFARHLYCLAQLIVPDDYAFPNIPRDQWTQIVADRDSSPLNYKRFLQIRARILAQWAVNVVDFRDADSSMTRFPYDPDPLDKLFMRFNPAMADPGWKPRRWNNSQSAPVAWGMEQPELLLTESLAFHDLRIRKDPQPSPEWFDQFRIPQGSLFLELYCPRSTWQGAMPNLFNRLQGVSPSLYRTNGGDVMLDVSKLSPPNTSNVQFPIWRVFIGGPVDRSTSRVHKTPNERMLNLQGSGERRIDLTYQLPQSNRRLGAPIAVAGTHKSGLVYDYTGLIRDSRNPKPVLPLTENDNTERLPDPDPDQSRIIVFSRNFTPTADNSPGVANPETQVFRNTGNGDILLRGNQYLVVGPRAITQLGSLTASRPSPASPPLNRPSSHRIELNNNWCDLFGWDSSGTPIRYRTSGEGKVRPAVTMTAANLLRPSNWTGTSPDTSNFRIGLNVSEPLGHNYYDEPTSKVNSANNSGYLVDGYFDYISGGRTNREPAFDNGSRWPLRLWDLDEDGSPDVVPDPKAQNALVPGTQEDWCTAYLQRLADPNRPWDEALNPYITVDWMPIDLTVFSGEEDAGIFDSAEPMRLASRQKCGQPVHSATLQFQGGANPGLNGQTFYSSLTHSPRQSSQAAGASAFLKVKLDGDHYLDPGNGNPPAGSERPSVADQLFVAEHTSAPGKTAAFATLGFLNSSYVLSSEPGTSMSGLVTSPFGMYDGGPSDPLKQDKGWTPSTLFWADRAFVNSLELAYVPVSSPGQIGQEFSATRATGNEGRYATTYWNSGEPMRPTSPAQPENVDYQYPFGHLLNFFQEAPELLAPRIPVGSLHAKDTGLAMLLDLVETPSPWADVEEIQPASTFVMSGGTTEALATNAVLSPFQAPYNVLSRGVEPGRVNLNTASESDVLQGLFSNTDPARRVAFGSYTTEFDQFVRARRGYDPVVGNLGAVGNNNVNSPTALNANFPTQFAGAFKPWSEGGMVPPTRNVTSTDPTLQYLLSDGRGVIDLYARRNPVGATLMRPGIQSGDATTGLHLSSAVPALQPPHVLASGAPHSLSDMYHVSRLQNLVTERSNVFAVYITVGFFDYSEVGGGSIGREYGLDNGQNKRLRAFYVIDRSIPVGYRVGEDLNTENTILIRRYLSE